MFDETDEKNEIKENGQNFKCYLHFCNPYLWKGNWFIAYIDNFIHFISVYFFFKFLTHPWKDLDYKFKSLINHICDINYWFDFSKINFYLIRI